MRTANLLFIGGGNMSYAIVSGLINDGYNPNKIWVYDHNTSKLNDFSHSLRVNVDTDAKQAIKLADVIILAVKPQSMAQLAQEVGAEIAKQESLVISIAAGIKLQDLNIWFGHELPIVRAMPNTPALVKAGVTGLYANQFTSKQQHDLAEKIMRAVGTIVWLKSESDIDTLTALSGCGPGYLAMIMEIMQQQGEKLGLDPKIAHTLVLQTVFGFAKLALESQEPLSKLKQKVISKGGATAVAIEKLEELKLEDIIAQALLAAKERCHELSETFGIDLSITEKSTK